MVQSPDNRIDTLRDFFAQDPSNLNLLAEISDLALAAGRPADAREAAEKGLKLNPGDPFFLLRLSSAAIGERSYETSLSLTRLLLGRGHSNPAIIYNHAYALACVERFAEVRDFLTGQAHLDSGCVRLLVRAHHYLGDIDSAIEAARCYLAAFPGDIDITGILSLLYVDIEQFDRAADLADEVLHKAPHHIDALLATGTVALALENADRANFAAMRALEVQPLNGRAWMIKGLACLLKLEPTAALPNLQKTVECQARHIGSWHLLGWTQLMLGDMSAAETSFRQALAIDDNFGESHGAMATLAAMKGDWTTAESEATIARRLDPHAMSAYYPSLIKAQKEGRPEVVAGIVERALRSGRSPMGDSLVDMAVRARTSMK